jgi:hypothetical protein
MAFVDANVLIRPPRATRPRGPGAPPRCSPPSTCSYSPTWCWPSASSSWRRSAGRASAGRGADARRDRVTGDRDGRPGRAAARPRSTRSTAFFAEAYLVAQAEATGVGGIISVGRSIDRVTRRHPARTLTSDVRALRQRPLVDPTVVVRLSGFVRASGERGDRAARRRPLVSSMSSSPGLRSCWSSSPQVPAHVVDALARRAMRQRAQSRSPSRA